MLCILYPFNALLMIGMPVALGAWLAWKKAPWLLFGIGAVTFIGLQIVHIPLNLGLAMLFAQISPSNDHLLWRE